MKCPGIIDKMTKVIAAGGKKSNALTMWFSV